MLAATPWQMTIGERAGLEGVLAQLRPALAIEIGTAEGGSLTRVAEYSDEVHSFDLVDPQLPVAELDHVHLHVGDGHALLPEFLAELSAAGRNVDFVLVDGDHSADGVRRDLVDLLESDAIGQTVILLHDTINEEVRAGIDAVDYRHYEKVRIFEPDAIPGTMSLHPNYLGQLWGGLGVIVCGSQPLELNGGDPIIASCVPPTALGLGGRALAGTEVARDTDFVALAQRPAAQQPVNPRNIAWRDVLRALATFPARARDRIRASRSG
jgi:hypothetical protein